mmetsp:Transcript_40847/g.107225  ORF Transcript_40847/g.107225 Transcript_40847/m.107225 type:complete len:82 (+) Transcript_40847:597-842(+)
MAPGAAGGHTLGKSLLGSLVVGTRQGPQEHHPASDHVFLFDPRMAVLLAKGFGEWSAGTPAATGATQKRCGYSQRGCQSWR